MEKNCDYSYLPCQFCVGKNHCEQCGGEIRNSLSGIDGVLSVEMDVPARRVSIVFEGVDFDDIADQADALGVFL